MATRFKAINGTLCSSADWGNLTAATKSIQITELDALIQKILHHPMKSCISVLWVYSYYYRKAKIAGDYTFPETKACKKVLKILDSFL